MSTRKTRKIITKKQKLLFKHTRKSNQAQSAIILAVLTLVTLSILGINHLHSSKDGFIPVPGQVHYTKGIGLTATYPKGWTIDDSKSTNPLIGLVQAQDAKDDDKATSLIIIAREPVEANAEDKLLKMDTSDALDHTRIIKTQDAQIDNLAGKIRETTSDAGHEELIVAVDSNRVGYIITVNTPESDWKALQPKIETFIRSIKLDK